MSELFTQSPGVCEPREEVWAPVWQRGAAGVLRWLLVVLAAAVVAGSLLLVSIPGPPIPLTDAVEVGRAPMMLLRLIDALGLYYVWPTSTGTEIKSTVLEVGLAGAAVLLGMAWILRGLVARRSSVASGPTPGLQAEWHVRWLGQTELVDVAQALLVLVVLWSAISRVWSPAPELSIRATVIIAVQAAWALSLSRGLAMAGPSHRTVRAIAVALVLSCLFSTVLALGFTGLPRWPVESFFPVGRGRLFAACLVPAVLLTIAWMVGETGNVLRGPFRQGVGRWSARVLGLIALIVVLAVLILGNLRAGSRAAWVGCLAGLITLVWLAVSRRAKIVVSVVGLAVMLVVVLGLIRFAGTSGSFEAADVRLCNYGWRYALQTWAQSRGTGIGQAGYTMSCEPWRLADLIDDPTAVGARWRGHAQNEWLEVLTDLGLVGFHLTIGVYVLTLMGGTRALRQLEPGPLRRCLIGLMAAMVGMGVEACMSSALRHEPLPALWYTILGSVWAILLSCRLSARTLWLNWPLRAGGVVVLFLLGLATAAGSWRCFLGEHVLALSGRRLRTHRIAEAFGMTDRVLQDTLRPRHHAQARLNAARAHWGIGAQQMARVFYEVRQAVGAASTLPASQPAATTQPVDILWADPSFQLKWGRAKQHLERALDLLGVLNAKQPGFFGAAALEAEVCLALDQLWQLPASLTGPQARHAVGEAADQIRRYRRRRITALIAAMERQPFNDDLLVSLFRANMNLPLPHVIDLLRRPMRGPLPSEEYRSVILQVSTYKGFKEAFEPFVQRARRDTTAAGRDEWVDTFSPETLRIAAIILAAEGNMKQAVETATLSVRLYASEHQRFSVQQALAMTELGWYQLINDPTDPNTALQTLRRAVVECERPIGNSSLQPIFRRVIQAVLVKGDEVAARRLASAVPWADGEVDPNLALAWAYEVLGRTFHRLGPDKRPKKWPVWVDRAAELDPNSPSIQVMVAAKACEQGDDERAAASLERVWEQSTSLKQRQECLRTLLYALRKNPRSRPLRRLELRITREFRASTQRAPTTATTAPAARPARR